MPVHEEVLAAARRLCRERRGWRFRPLEVVRALPHLNKSTVRTHVVSRCCVNAPKNHPHKWDYFRRVGRGIYEIRRPHRESKARENTTRAAGRRAMEPSRALGEAGAVYRSGTPAAPRETVHAVVTRDGDWYVGECLEIAVVTQGRTLDELVANLQEAIGLHLEGEENPARLGVVAKPRLALTYELAALPR